MSKAGRRWREHGQRRYSILGAVLTLAGGVVVATLFGWGDSAVFWGLVGGGVGASLVAFAVGPHEAARYPASAAIQEGSWHTAWITDRHPRRAVTTYRNGERSVEVWVAQHAYRRDAAYRHVAIGGERVTLTHDREGHAHHLPAGPARQPVRVRYSTSGNDPEQLTITSGAVVFEVPICPSDDPVDRLRRTRRAVEVSDASPQLGAFVMAYVAADQYRSLRSMRQRFGEMLHAAGL